MPAALRVFQSTPATCWPPPRWSLPRPAATPPHWSHRRSCSSCIRPDHAAPTSRESSRPSAPTPQNAAVAPGADDTIFACVVGSTALPTASIAARSPRRSATHPRSPVVSYLGLNPKQRSSSDKQHTYAISKQGNTMMRWLLVEAAQTAVRFDPELQRVYRRLKFNKGASVAKVAVARKLAVKLYWMLRATASCAQMAPMQGSSRGTLVPQVGSTF